MKHEEPPLEWPEPIWDIVETNTGLRLEFLGMSGAAYAVRYIGRIGGPFSWQWLILTARNREIEIERADVDASTDEMDSAELAILDAEREQ